MNRKIPVEVLERYFQMVIKENSSVTDLWCHYKVHAENPVGEVNFKTIFNDYMTKRAYELHKQQKKFPIQEEIKELIFTELATPITVGEVIVKENKMYLKENPMIQVVPTRIGFAKAIEEKWSQ